MADLVTYWLLMGEVFLLDPAERIAFSLKETGEVILLDVAVCSLDCKVAGDAFRLEVTDIE